MPAVANFPPADEIPELVLGERTERNQLYEMAWRYYRGRHRVYVAKERVRVNLVKRAVNQAVSLLVGIPPEVDIVEGVMTDVEERLKAILDRNNFPIFLHNLALTGALTGHCFVLITRDMAGDVHIKWLTDVIVYWDEADMTAVHGYSVFSGDRFRLDVIRMANGWEMVLFERVKERWTEINRELVPWQPVVDWQNLPNPREYYGLPDVDGIDMELNDAVNFISQNTVRIIRFHAHPRTVGIGLNPKDVVQTAVDGFFTVQNPEAKVFNLEMQSDLSSSLAFLNFLRGEFMAATRTVDISTVKDQAGRLTNFGLRVLFSNALEKLDTKRALYGKGIARVCENALLAAGGIEARVHVHWQDPLPFNRAELIQAIEKEIDLGLVSRETASRELGRDWEVEQQRILAEGQTIRQMSEKLLDAMASGFIPNQ